MPQLKIAVVLLIAIILQLSLRAVGTPLSYIDFPLVVVVYIALQRHAWHALIVGTIAGLAIDAPSGGLIGAGGFSKTLTGFRYWLQLRCSIQRFMCSGTAHWDILRARLSYKRCHTG